ncbi:MAG: hypothetical protein ACJ78H_01300 [Chloroflexota bacterium]
MGKDEALKRLGGGRWETRDGRFQIEPESGTWVIVDTTQTNEFGLPLVRGPFPSLGAAKQAIETAREDGPVESPLAERISQPKPPTQSKARTSKGKATTKARRETEPEPEPAPPPEPKWIRDLRPVDRRKATALIEKLDGLDLEKAKAEAVARTEIGQGLPGLARLAIERRIRAATARMKDAESAAKATVDILTAGEDPDLGVSWRLVDDRGRPIEKLDVDP